MSRIDWIGETQLSAEDVLRRPKRRQGRPSRMDEYVAFIRERLADGRTMPANRLKDLVAKRFEIGDKTYRAARKRPGVQATKGGFQGESVVFVPAD